MNTSRRDFLKGSLSAGAALPAVTGQLAPQWLQGLGGAPAAANKIVVILQLRGGYDFLNTLPPNHPMYFTARPNIGIPAASTLGPIQTGGMLQWHPSLAAFKALYDAGKCAIIQGVGYPSPNLSHFESEKIYYAADRNVVLVDKGWLGKWLKNAYTGGYQIPAIDLETSMVPAFNGALVPVLANPATFRFSADAGTPNDNNLALAVLKQNAMFLRPTAHPNLQYAAAGIIGANNDSAVLQNTGASYQPHPQALYPNSGLSTTLRTVARYVIYGLQTQCYYLNTGGFDNHANEVQLGNPSLGTLANLLAGVSQSVKAFLDDVRLQAPSRAPDVMVMLFTEFGRRTGENGSVGTDHGHQSLAWMLGENVIGGLYGKYPDLNTVTAPYANHYFGYVANQTTDFRSMYATVLEKWLQVPHAPILGATYPLIPCL